MKTTDHLDNFKSAKKEAKEVAKRGMYANMVAQNIADLIPAEWVGQRIFCGIRYKPAEGVTVTPDMLDKLAAKLAKAFNYEPSITVTPATITADFWVFPSMNGRYYGSINLEFTIGNTEACDFVPKRRWRVENEPTGYCLVLKEKKYLQTSEN